MLQGPESMHQTEREREREQERLWINTVFPNAGSLSMLFCWPVFGTSLLAIEELCTGAIDVVYHAIRLTGPDF